MRANVAALCFSIFLGSAACMAQQPIVSSTQPVPEATQPDYTHVYCSGFVADQKVPDEVRVVSGEQSNYKITFGRGDNVIISHGSNDGLRVGDRFLVYRAETDPLQVNWFKWQAKLMKAMGTVYTDVGQIQIVDIQPKTAIAEVTFSCGMMQRGDIVRPFLSRPVGPYKEAGKFNHFAPVNGKPVAMVVAGKDWAQMVGQRAVVYVNLGTGQGVKVGDYFRFFRYQGSMADTAPQTKGYQYQLYGFGSAPTRYEWKDLPREVLGEGIVLNASANASTVLITYDTAEVYTGDYVELE